MTPHHCDMQKLQRFSLENAKQTHTNAETCQDDGYGIKHGLVAVALQMPYVAVCNETAFYLHQIDHGLAQITHKTRET